MLNYLDILHSHYEEYHPEEKSLGDAASNIITNSTPCDEKSLDSNYANENIVNNKTIDEDTSSECNIRNETVNNQPLVDIKTTN